MRIFTTHYFHRWLKTVNITNQQLKIAIQQMANNLHDGNLGAQVYKKRLATSEQGKRGAFRTIIIYKKKEKAFFVYGYAKNIRANISSKEKKAYKKLSKIYIKLDESGLKKLLEANELVEIK